MRNTGKCFEHASSLVGIFVNIGLTFQRLRLVKEAQAVDIAMMKKRFECLR